MEEEGPFGSNEPQIGLRVPYVDQRGWETIDLRGPFVGLRGPFVGLKGWWRRRWPGTVACITLRRPYVNLGKLSVGRLRRSFASFRIRSFL